MGIRSKVSRSTLAEANEMRDWRIYADFAHHLIGIARKLYQKEPFGSGTSKHGLRPGCNDDRSVPVHFPWHDSGQQRGCPTSYATGSAGQYPKLHTHLRRKLHEVNVLDIIPLEAGAFYIMDRGYTDFSRLYAVTQASAFS
jgi:hypothetical protein